MSTLDFGGAEDDDEDLESFMTNMSMTRTAFRHNGGELGEHHR
jgi:hypothetical protein